MPALKPADRIQTQLVWKQPNALVKWLLPGSESFIVQRRDLGLFAIDGAL